MAHSFFNSHHNEAFFVQIVALKGPKLNKSTRQTILASLTVAVLSIGVRGQESSSLPMLLRVPAIQGIALAPNFRVTDFRLETADESAAPDSPDNSSSSKQREGLVKRSIKRIGEDQKRLYLAPFEPHNFKWDAIVLVGTGAFLAADRHIENNISHSNFTAYQATSDLALAGLAGSLAGIYIYGFKTEHRHARETGAIALETLVNTFLIYTPMQLIFARQRPDEGNGHGDFFKHHSINTSFPGGHAMFTWAMASVLADEYPKPWARVLSYGAAFTVTFPRFIPRAHWASDMFIGTGLGLAIAENTFHSHCDPQYQSHCKHHQ